MWRACTIVADAKTDGRANHHNLKEGPHLPPYVPEKTRESVQSHLDLNVPVLTQLSTHLLRGKTEKTKEKKQTKHSHFH